MNKRTNTITRAVAASDFPIPYAGSDATDELYTARAFFRILQAEIERASGRDNGMPRSTASDMLYLLCEVSERLQTLQRYFDDDEVPSVQAAYQRVRRTEILERWEVTQ